MEPPQDQAQGRCSRLLPWALGVLAAGIALAAGYALGQPLGDAAAVRGLIAVVVSLAAVGVALVLVLGSVLQTHTRASRRGSARGRDVLLALTGILGTIVGFYLSSNDAAPSAGPPLAIHANVDSAGDGGWLVASAFIDGGTPPFEYQLTLPGAAGGAGQRSHQFPAVGEGDSPARGRGVACRHGHRRRGPDARSRWYSCQMPVQA